MPSVSHILSLADKYLNLDHDAIRRLREWNTIGIAACGALLGCLVSLTVNCTLIEIAINPFFSTYFGVVFLIIGVGLMWRIHTGDHQKSPLLMIFASLVVLSGIFCFALEETWMLNVSYLTKIPMFVLLGQSVCFAFLFSFLDMLNLVLYTGPEDIPIIDSEKQIQLVVFTSFILGSIVGLIFGTLDVEDQVFIDIRGIMNREQTLCYPFAILIGSSAAVVNQYFRWQKTSFTFQPLNKDSPFDDDLDDL